MVSFTRTDDADAPIVATYARDDERYLVSFVVSYDAREASGPAEAIELAVDLITGFGSGDTLWCVLDRQTGVRHVVEQGDALSEWPTGVRRASHQPPERQRDRERRPRERPRRRVPRPVGDRHHRC